MSAIRRILLGGGQTLVKGQQHWTTPGSYRFVVPAGVYAVSGVAIAPGTVGLGGGLHWRNSMQVTPGETLTVVVGQGIIASASLESSLRRGSSYLLRTYASSTYKDGFGGGGGNGGGGAYLSGSAGAGGAGGYMGNGGNGGGAGGPPAANSGGGQGGAPFSDGGGVGLEGRTVDFAPGSRGTPKCGAGIGEGEVGGDGGVRLMWGASRSYPDAAVGV